MGQLPGSIELAVEHDFQVRNKKGEYGRLSFQSTLSCQDVREIEDMLETNGQPTPQWLEVLKQLPNPFNHYGWWRPMAFSEKALTLKLHESSCKHLDPQNMGWHTMRELRKHIKDATAWLRNCNIELDCNTDDAGNTPASQHAIFTGSAILDDIDRLGIRIDTLSKPTLLKAQVYAIYSDLADAYYTPKGSFRGLPHAWTFPTQDGAEYEIEHRQLKRVQVVRLDMCVEHIPKPDIVGERMKLDLIARHAEQIDEATLPAANPSHNRKRRI